MYKLQITEKNVNSFFSDDLQKFIAAGIPLHPLEKESGKPLYRYTQNPGIRTISELFQWKRKGSERYGYIPCPMIVLDIDRHGNGIDGLESLKNYFRTNRIKIPDALKTTTYVKTPRNGYHFLFRYSGEPVLNHECLPGCEIKFSSLVTAAGSRSKYGRYELVGSLSDVQPFPRELMPLLVPRKRKTENRTVYVSDIIQFEKIEEVMRSQGYRFIEGSRDRDCFQFALFASRRGKSPEDTISYLSKFAERDFPLSQIQKCVRSGYTTARGV